MLEFRSGHGPSDWGLSGWSLLPARAVRAGDLAAGSEPDSHMKVGKTIYNVSWKNIGQTVNARSTHDLVEFSLGGELIKTHVRKPEGKSDRLCRLSRGYVESEPRLSSVWSVN